MTRKTARELALQLSFAAAMSGSPAADVLDDFFDSEHYAGLAAESPLFRERPDARALEYIRALVRLTDEHRAELDACIGKYASGWKAERISGTAMAIMRGAICEILYMDDVPAAAAINEAVELAKRYAEPDTAAFINGVLGSFVRGEPGLAPAGEAE